jgi:hypothetical protein
VKGISEKFKCIGDQYNIRMIFKTKYILRSLLMEIRLQRDAQQTTQCKDSISYECSRSYIGETGRPLAMRLHEHIHSLKEGPPENSKIAQHA